MPGLITVGIVIFYILSLSCPSAAMAFTVATTVTQTGTHSKATAQSTSKADKAEPSFATQANRMNVVNIVVDKMEGGRIYAKDGNTFNVPGSAKVIDNSHRATKMRTAELVFENETLVSVILK